MKQSIGHILFAMAWGLTAMAAILVAIAALLNNDTNDVPSPLEIVASSDTQHIIIDHDSGCHYILIKYKGARLLIPRLNIDGTSFCHLSKEAPYSNYDAEEAYLSGNPNEDDEEVEDIPANQFSKFIP